MKPPRLLIAALALCCVAVLAGCSTSGSARRGGGYYQNDGPGDHPPADIDAIPDAIPRIETPFAATSRPYVVFGKRYVPISGDTPFRQEGTASWYGRQFHGGKTSNGETYDMYAMTAAHPTLPIPSYARVTRVSTGKSVIVRINDRGPFHSSRIIDLSYVAAAKLGIIGPGSGQVIVQAITNTDIARGLGTRTAKAPAPARPQIASSSSPAQAVAVSSSQPATARPIATERRISAPAPSTPDALSVISGPPAAMAAGGSATASEAPASAPASGVYLQFGAFSTPENARSLAQKLNQKIALPDTPPIHVQAANNLYRVQMGPYPSRAEAIDAAARIQQQTGAQPSLVAAR